MPRIDDFLKNIYEEKIKHKDHRMNLVFQKLIFTIGIFGIGSIGIPTVRLDYLLYLVPFVSLAYDIYIFSEDYKVKRIGVFLQTQCQGVCNEEKEWEIWVSGKREPLAAMGSLVLTVISLIASAITIYNKVSVGETFYTWLFLTVIAVLCAYFYARILRSELKNY